VYAQDTNTEENLRRVLETHGSKLEDLSIEQRQQALDALNTMSAKPQASSSPSASPNASPSPSTDKKTARAAKTKKPTNEIVIDLGATLAQKGYPAPVDLDTGSGKTGTAATKRKSNS
jgi:ribosomal protein L12E/L44/L45/RPP1/RPP2